VSPRPASGSHGEPVLTPGSDGRDRAQVPGPLRIEAPLGRGSVERSPVPGRSPATVTGASDPLDRAQDRYAERSAQVASNAAIVLVATIVVGQLWALTVALDAWLGGDEGIVRWILAFQVTSFAVSVAVWTAATRMAR
jgi:hypothetical protein